LGERPDIWVIVTSPRERLNEIHMKVTSDGGEAERLNSLWRGIPSKLRGYMMRGKKWLDRE
jgi:hypothetical protein